MEICRGSAKGHNVGGVDLAQYHIMLSHRDNGTKQLPNIQNFITVSWIMLRSLYRDCICAELSTVIVAHTRVKRFPLGIDRISTPWSDPKLEAKQGLP